MTRRERPSRFAIGDWVACEKYDIVGRISKIDPYNGFLYLQWVVPTHGWSFVSDSFTAHTNSGMHTFFWPLDPITELQPYTPTPEEELEWNLAVITK